MFTNNIFEWSGFCTKILNKKYLFICIYRPPNSDVDFFLKELECFLSNISKSSSNIYVPGDFNIDIAINDNTTNSFKNAFASYNMHPLINQPTRISTTHSSIIDNIFTNNNSRSIIKGIICDDISDHLPIFAYIPIKFSIPEPKRPNIILRHLEENDVLYANNLLLNTFCGNRLVNNDSHDVNIDSTYNSFLSDYLNCINIACPLLCKKNRFRKPWMTSKLYESYIIKNNLYKKYLLNPTTGNKIAFNKYKNYFTKIKRIAEKMFYEQNFLKCNKIKDKWKLINETLNQNKVQPTKLFNNIDTKSEKMLKLIVSMNILYN